MKPSLIILLFVFSFLLVSAQVFSPVFNTKSRAKLETSRDVMIRMAKVADRYFEFKQGNDVAGFPYFFCNGNGNGAIQIIGQNDDVKYFSWFAVFGKSFDPNEMKNKVLIEVTKAATGPKGAVWATKSFYHLQKLSADVVIDTIINKSIAVKIDFTPSTHLISVDVKTF